MGDDFLLWLHNRGLYKKGNCVCHSDEYLDLDDDDVRRMMPKARQPPTEKPPRPKRVHEIPMAPADERH